jgi:hypothetical protein
LARFNEYLAGEGIIFRVVGRDHRPGMVYKDKANWVWEEKSLDISILMAEKMELKVQLLLFHLLRDVYHLIIPSSQSSSE